jgi:LPXTG-motif cell wall-anchored protein
MKRLVFSILMILALTTGAAFAQSTINTTPPGPTQQQEPGLTNNNLPNPGNPQTQAGNESGQSQPVQEEGTVEGTATESINNEATGDETQDNTTGTLNTTGSTGSTTGTMNTTGTTGTTNLQNETETGTGVDVDVDTGANASGAMDVDVSSTTDADTDASGVDETGSLDQETTYSGDTDSLPATGSELPLLGLIGLLALAAAFAVRRF